MIESQAIFTSSSSSSSDSSLFEEQGLLTSGSQSDTSPPDSPEDKADDDAWIGPDTTPRLGYQCRDESPLIALHRTQMKSAQDAFFASDAGYESESESTTRNHEVSPRGKSAARKKSHLALDVFGITKGEKKQVGEEATSHSSGKFANRSRPSQTQSPSSIISVPSTPTIRAALEGLDSPSPITPLPQLRSSKLREVISPNLTPKPPPRQSSPSSDTSDTPFIPTSPLAHSESVALASSGFKASTFVETCARRVDSALVGLGVSWGFLSGFRQEEPREDGDRSVGPGPLYTDGLPLSSYSPAFSIDRLDMHLNSDEISSQHVPLLSHHSDLNSRSAVNSDQDSLL